MKDKGVTFIELLIVIAIIGILAVALGFSYVGWYGKYKVENETRTLYSAMLSAQSQAMGVKQNYFLDISPDGRFYRISEDDSDGTAKIGSANVTAGDGIFQPQAVWTVIEASNPVNWGTSAVTTDTTINGLSHMTVLSTQAGSLAGLYSATGAAPFTGANNFVLGFGKRGVIRNMTGQTDIEAAAPIPATNGLSICIFTDYDNDSNHTSDYDPDYDCINIRDTKITLGKLLKQNTDTTLTAGTACQDAFDASTNTYNTYGCLSK